MINYKDKYKKYKLKYLNFKNFKGGVMGGNEVERLELIVEIKENEYKLNYLLTTNDNSNIIQLIFLSISFLSLDYLFLQMV